MVVLMKILQVILALSLLVVVHEFGHYLWARIFKIKVEKFYLFFDPFFSLFKYKPKNSDTEFGIGWIPFGGYCKIAGMIDESMDKEQLAKPAEPWEFRSKPAWQRIFVMAGGVLNNFILAILIYWGVLYVWGEQYIKNQDVDTGVYVSELGKEIGFRNGDRIISFNGGEPIERFEDVVITLIRTQATYATVLRGEDTVTVEIDPSYIPTILSSLKSGRLFEYGIPFTIAEVPQESPNAASGLMQGDRIVAINNSGSGMLMEVMESLQSFKNDSVVATVARGNELLYVPLSVDSLGRIGVIVNNNVSDFYKTTRSNYSFFGALPAGIERAVVTVKNYWQELKLIFTPKTEAYKSVGSFIAIGKIFPDTWNWKIFWSITAFLSIMLAVLNLLPIPALDGGHILFTLYELITGRKPSERVLEIAQIVGMVILFGIMVLAFGNDIAGLFK
ncbi:MAG: RIP metalloprotease RseP [Candidatus Egerieousia sp.]|nr:RIP metalloprotease RseP [Candidatus Egerieousia sp.]